MRFFLLVTCFVNIGNIYGYIFRYTCSSFPSDWTIIGTTSRQCVNSGTFGCNDYGQCIIDNNEYQIIKPIKIKYEYLKNKLNCNIIHDIHSSGNNEIYFTVN